MTAVSGPETVEAVFGRLYCDVKRDLPRDRVAQQC